MALGGIWIHRSRLVHAAYTFGICRKYQSYLRQIPNLNDASAVNGSLPGTSHPFASPHAEDADKDEGDGEELSHVEWHIRLEVHLDVLGVLDEESECEDEGEHEAEVEA